jgi:hypothetical protein
MSVLNILHKQPKLSLSQVIQGDRVQPTRPSQLPRTDGDSEFAEFTV